MGKIIERKRSSKTGKEILLRTAQLEDSEKLNALALKIMQTSEFLVTQPDEFSSFSIAQQSERIEKHLKDEGSVIILADFRGELLGMIDFSNGKRKRVAHKGVFGMSVHPDWRDQGIGHLLLSELISWVKAHPFLEYITLGVMAENLPAIALYKKHGFVETGRELYGIKLNDGTYMPDINMSLKVK